MSVIVLGKSQRWGNDLDTQYIYTHYSCLTVQPWLEVVSEGEEDEPSVGRRGRRSTRRQLSESQSEHENAPPPR